MYQAVLKFIKKPLIKLIISVLILIVVFIWVPLEALWMNMKKVSLASWLFVFSGFIAGHLLGAVKWRLLINMGESDVSFGAATRFYFAGLFANLFLPSLAGGDVVKAGLAIRSDHKKGTTIFGTLMDRMIDTASVVLIIIVAFLFSPEFIQPQDKNIIYIILLFFFAGGLVGAFFLKLPTEKIKSPKIAERLKKIKQTMLLIRRQPVRPVLAFGLSCLIQTGFILLTIFFAELLGIHIPLILWFLVWPLAKLTALLPISLGGIGVREVALAALLGRLGVPAATSVALGLLWESILISGGLFGGILYMTTKFFSNQKLPSLSGISKSTNRIKN